MPDVTATPELTLRDGVEIPQIGFGVFQIPPEETRAAVEEALDAGYRHIDTAAAYGNERGVGEAIAASAIPREEVFVTTKVWNTDQGYENALAAFEKSVGRLEFDYVDLYLIHWPLPGEDRFVETWRGLERIHDEGRARTIGVSNFRIADLERLLRETETAPTINQVELHPSLQQTQLREWHADHEIATEAWSPLAKGELLDDETIGSIAAGHGKTAAQVILRWHLQLGNVVIPKSATPERIRENLEVLEFALSDEDMRAIAGLDAGERTGPDPGEFAY